MVKHALATAMGLERTRFVQRTAAVVAESSHAPALYEPLDPRSALSLSHAHTH